MKLFSRREISKLYDGFFIYRVQPLVLSKSILLNLASFVLIKCIYIHAAKRHWGNYKLGYFVRLRVGKRTAKGVLSSFSMAYTAYLKSAT